MLDQMMVDESAVTTLEAFAESYPDDELGIQKAAVALDERQDGEPVSRVSLLLNDPSGETWDVDRVRELRLTLGRKATELHLPPVSLTLVAQSEEEAQEIFAE